MHQKVSHVTSAVRLFWDECLKVCLGFGTLGGAVLGVAVGICLFEPTGTPWAPLLALRSAVVGGLLGTAMGAIFGAICGVLTGSVLIVGLAVDGAAARSSPRLSLTPGAPAEVAPARAPLGGGDEPSPSSLLTLN
jgi:hypothetical protein